MAIEADQRTRGRPEKGKGKGPGSPNFESLGNTATRNRDLADSPIDRRRPPPRDATRNGRNAASRGDVRASYVVTATIRGRITNSDTDILVMARRDRADVRNDASV